MVARGQLVRVSSLLPPRGSSGVAGTVTCCALHPRLRTLSLAHCAVLLSQLLIKLHWPLSRACTFLFISIFLDLYVWSLPLSTVLLCYFKFYIYTHLYYWFLGLLEHSYWLKEIKAFLLPELISSCRVNISRKESFALTTLTLVFAAF